jgi:hypothetical protein
MNPDECRVEFLQHFAERGSKCGPAADQHIVMAETQFTGAGGSRQSHDFPQSAPHAVSLHGVAHLS